MILTKGLKDTILSCLYRIKNIPIYLNHYKGSFSRLEAHDQNLKDLMIEIEQDSENLTQKFQQLYSRLHHIPEEEEITFPNRNRRQSDRLKIEGEGTFLFRNKTGKTYLLKDLSNQGVGVIGNHPLEKNELVDVVIASPFFKDSMYKDARIVWAKQTDNESWEGGVSFNSKIMRT